VARLYFTELDTTVETLSEEASAETEDGTEETEAEDVFG
jgi:hypothetical protein